MKHLTILVPDGQGNLSTVTTVIGAYEIFTVANTQWRKSGKRDVFRVEIAGISKKVDIHEGLVSVKPQVHISDISKTHLIIIPSSWIPGYKKAAKGNQLLMDWIVKQYKNGAEVASCCSGALMLASTGLLAGKNCSTHWMHAETFRNLFPEVNLMEEDLITDENGIYTNGGGYSFLNFMIYLVEKYYDRPTAIYCSKFFQIEMDRQSQSAFTIFTGQKLHGDEMVKKAQAYLENKLHEKTSVEDLSSMFSVGRRNFDRRFIKERVKMEAAKKAFETTRKNINEVMYEVGYSDAKAFREVFRKITGISPLEYRKKYNKEAVVG